MTTPHPADLPPEQRPAARAERIADADRLSEEPPPALPELFRGPFGTLDVDSLRRWAPQVRAGLIDALRSSTHDLRAARGTVMVPEDTYDAVRRLTAAQEVLTQWSQAFAAAATEAAALITEEAVTAMGEQDGVPNGSLFVPDGEGQRIAVRNDWTPGDSTWDVASLVGWLVDDEVADYKAGDALQQAFRHANTSAPMLWSDDEVREVARNVAARLIGLDGLPGLGRFTPSAKAIDNLRKKLAELGRDAEAAVLRQVRSVGDRKYRGVKITREQV